MRFDQEVYEFEKKEYQDKVKACQAIAMQPKRLKLKCKNNLEPQKKNF